MSRRLDRNTAKALARRTQQQRVSYFKGLGDFLTLCQIRAYNTWEGEALVWQSSATNVWVEVLAND
jgi:hypothetical protein